jgi:predicted dehydrogenase
MSKIRVGIIGSGSICRHRHAPEYSALSDDVEIVAFADRVPERAEWCAKKFGGKAHEKWEDVVAQRDVDAISVCTSNYAHAPITIAALNAGKHVLCEKPMATSLDEANAMIEAASRRASF